VSFWGCVADREELSARRRAFSCSSSATRLRKDVMVSQEEDRGKRGGGGTYTSMHSNSSRLRCLERKAAARFLTRRASLLLRPETSGGIKSLLEIRSPIARFFVALGAGLAERFEPQEEPAASLLIAISSRESAEREGEREAGVGGRALSGAKSKTWWVGRQRRSGLSRVGRVLSILEAGTGEPSEMGGEGGIL
jgi:hypothetical protein